MICRKAGGRRKEERFRQNDEEIERVRELEYLGYTVRENNEDKHHIKKVVRKANMILGKVWGDWRKTTQR